MVTFKRSMHSCPTIDETTASGEESVEGEVGRVANTGGVAEEGG